MYEFEQLGLFFSLMLEVQSVVQRLGHLDHQAAGQDGPGSLVALTVSLTAHASSHGHSGDTVSTSHGCAEPTFSQRCWKNIEMILLLSHETISDEQYSENRKSNDLASSKRFQLHPSSHRPCCCTSISFLLLVPTLTIGCEPVSHIWLNSFNKLSFIAHKATRSAPTTSSNRDG